MTQPRLLVLDDDEAVGELLLAVARRAGFEARICAQPQPFFEAVAHWLPTHLAIDLMMPEMDGIEVMRRLAAAACPARIIISSGAGSTDTDSALHLANSLGLQMAGVLPKPFSLRSFRALLGGDAASTISAGGP